MQSEIRPVFFAFAQQEDLDTFLAHGFLRYSE
jgi:hypothetical protein